MATMTKISGSVESYAHKAAKATLAGWLREAAEDQYDDWINACGLSWRVNRPGPYWGVWEEYPFTENGVEINNVWDEDDWWNDLAGLREHGDRRYAQALRLIGCQTFSHVGSGNYGFGGIDTQFFGPTSCREREAPKPSNPIPTYNDMLELGYPPRAIVDVAVQHKGTIIYCMEVVHKHGLTPQKRAFLQSLGTICLVIPAAWILSQVERPKRLVVTEMIGTNYGTVRDIEIARAWR
jgi:hypothetical protein